MVLQIAADIGRIMDHLDPVLLQQGRRANARKL